MKTEKPITSSLGITQREAAALLQVSPSHWSMYESGKRSLPLAATQLLAEMLVYVDSREKTEKRIDDAAPHAMQKQIERLLRENEYQQLLLSRKMAATEKKHTAQRRLSYVTAFLNIRNKKEKVDASHQHVINRAVQEPAKDKNWELIKYELQKEIMELERLHLERRLHNVLP